MFKLYTSMLNNTLALTSFDSHTAQRLCYKISDAVIEKRVLKELYSRIGNNDLVIGLSLPL